MRNIWGYTLNELFHFVEKQGFPKFRGKQIHDYLYKRNISSFKEMTQFPKSMRERLAEVAEVVKPAVITQNTSLDAHTTKLLLRLHDGSLIETVCMHHDYGNSICISTQVGCAMGCIFCASTRNGLERNLSAGEMLAQIYAFREKYNIPIHSVVLMGAGEPLHNYQECLRFIRLCNDPNMLNISYRSITLSTCGIVPQIYHLSEEGLPITLAISLHAPKDEIRNQILPISKNFRIEDLIRSAKYYFEKTGRRVTFEYILIKNINASIEHAKELCNLVGKMNCHFNLIPVNGTEHIQLYPPSVKEIQSFKAILEAHNKKVTIRKQMGDEIQAACGQLKRQYLSKEQEN